MQKLPFENVRREELVRKNAQTSLKFGIRPEQRTVGQLLDYGIVNIDKPRGPTSHQVSAYVKQILGISKAGHSGTLDPAVTGVLPVALGRSTKIAQLLLLAGKEYMTVMHVQKPVPEGRLHNTISQFVGTIIQLPPVKSAVKRQLRPRNVYYVDILEVDGQDVLFRVGCQAGTYIRKLCHDIGQKLGTGAHMAELRRTKAGPFDESSLATLHDLTDAWHYYKEDGDEKEIRKIIQPVENAVSHLPKVWVLDTSVDTLAHGAILHIPGISKVHSGIKPGDLTAVMSLKDELIGFGPARMNSAEMMSQEKGAAVKLDKVLMPPGIYAGVEK